MISYFSYPPAIFQFICIFRQCSYLFHFLPHILNRFFEFSQIHLQKYLDSRIDSNPALFVTLDSPHSRLKISGVEIRLRELGRSLGLSRIHPHKFRRTMATRAIDKGMPIEQVQKILGHSQIDTTMQYAIVNQTNVKTSHQKYIA